MKNQEANAGLLEIKKQREQVIDGLSKIVPDEFAQEVDAKMNTKTLEELVGMEPQELLEFNILDDERVIVSPPDLNDTDKEFQYVKDYLIFIKKSMDFINQLDESIEEFNAIMDETNLKLTELTEKDSEVNIVTLTRNRLEKALDASSPGKQQDDLKASLEAFNDSFELTRMIELYKTISTENLKKEAKTEGIKLYNKYIKACRELKLSFDLTTLGDFEKECLPEEYHEFNNLFVIICMKYISKLTKHRGAERKTDGFFAAQLTSNVVLCMKNHLPEKDEKVFKHAVMELLDLFR